MIGGDVVVTVNARSSSRSRRHHAMSAAYDAARTRRLRLMTRLGDFGAFTATIGLALQPFQRTIVRAAQGPERELLVLLPRGNGKTTLMAALAVHHLLTVPDPAVYVAAASRDQARVLGEAARRFARDAGSEHLVIRHDEVRWVSDPEQPRVAHGHLRVIASDAPKAHGLTPSLVIVDELHAHADDELYLALRTAMLKRPGARMIVISTAGQGADTPLGQLRARALAQPTVQR
ncbi:MAG: hypothetical protein H0X17_23745, partial [Deltaproteobacteria bacterium]|nr:hypothetical protein [Deltaproteobacteria bacterium]